MSFTIVIGAFSVLGVEEWEAFSQKTALKEESIGTWRDKASYRS